MYIQRHIEAQILAADRSFPVILVTGPRQVGKTRLLRELAGSERHYVSLDDPQERILAQENPRMFLELHPTPLIIDEVQYAPELFPFIKMRVDEQDEDGVYWLTGSQVFSLMKGVRESLAGRVMIVRLQGISQQEEAAGQTHPFPPTQETLIHTPSLTLPSTLTDRMFRGSFPRLLTHPELSPTTFYASYVQTWLERDVAQITNILDTSQFLQFVRLLATRTAQELNMAGLAKEIQVDNKTISRWLDVLETSGLVYRLPAWSRNIGKRLIKRPKLYFLDSGLASYLCGMYSAESLAASPLFGAIYETWVVTELLKSYWHLGHVPTIFYYRDVNQKEIDLIIERDGLVHPFEIKSSTAPQRARKNFSVLDPIQAHLGLGGVIYRGTRLHPFDDRDWLIPDDRL